ncbi:YdeI/OmpD-associated family protein [Kordiimonas lacus]|nr:YdeI/OmpD-associated family protein [Kordiimonas lacus]
MTKVATKENIPGGVVHDLPPDLEAELTADPAVLAAWLDITPLARNEWICWVEDAKKAETRAKRIGRAGENLADGKRRPCCWPGCTHRVRDGGRT